VPVPLRQFRVTFERSQPPPPAPHPRRQWTGDAEPVPFPFTFGITKSIGRGLFDFDYEGQWLLTVTRNGLPYAWRLDNRGELEILPRALVHGRLPDEIVAVVGVERGFVLVGRAQKKSVLIHYDLSRRTVLTYELGPAATGNEWYDYAREHRAVVAKWNASQIIPILTIVPGKGASTVGGEGPLLRVLSSVRKLLCFNFDGPLPEHAHFCALDGSSGELRVSGVFPRWRKATPLVDGRPSLQGATVEAASFRGNVLAVRVPHPHLRHRLLVFRGPDAVPIAEYSNMDSQTEFVPSHDGRLFARQARDGNVLVEHLDGGDHLPPLIYRGGCAPLGKLLLGRESLVLSAGRKNLHILAWKSGVLKVHLAQGNIDDPKQLAALFQRMIPGVESRSPISQSPIKEFPDPNGYYCDRFTGVAEAYTHSAFMDRYGQAAVMDNMGRLCMFFVFRSELSGWLPDGTCFGPASSSRQPPSPEILAKFGQALIHASAAPSSERNLPVEGGA